MHRLLLLELIHSKEFISIAEIFYEMEKYPAILAIKATSTSIYQSLYQLRKYKFIQDLSAGLVQITPSGIEYISAFNSMLHPSHPPTTISANSLPKNQPVSNSSSLMSSQKSLSTKKTTTPFRSPSSFQSPLVNIDTASDPLKDIIEEYLLEYKCVPNPSKIATLITKIRSIPIDKNTTADYEQKFVEVFWKGDLSETPAIIRDNLGKFGEKVRKCLIS